MIHFNQSLVDAQERARVNRDETATIASVSVAPQLNTQRVMHCARHSPKYPGGFNQVQASNKKSLLVLSSPIFILDGLEKRIYNRIEVLLCAGCRRRWSRWAERREYHLCGGERCICLFRTWDCLSDERSVVEKGFFLLYPRYKQWFELLQQTRQDSSIQNIIPRN